MTTSQLTIGLVLCMAVHTTPVIHYSSVYRQHAHHNGDSWITDGVCPQMDPHCDLRYNVLGQWQCKNHTCTNDGTCHNTIVWQSEDNIPIGLQARCTCPPHFEGEFCEKSIFREVSFSGSCSDDQCGHGRCYTLRLPSGVHAGEYKCTCDESWMGAFCDKEIYQVFYSIKDWADANGRDLVELIYASVQHAEDTTDCAENICMNGATCIADEYGYHCLCTPRFKGMYCENYVFRALYEEHCSFEEHCSGIEHSFPLCYNNEDLDLVFGELRKPYNYCICQDGWAGYDCSLESASLMEIMESYDNMNALAIAFQADVQETDAESERKEDIANALDTWLLSFDSNISVKSSLPASMGADTTEALPYMSAEGEMNRTSEQQPSLADAQYNSTFEPPSTPVESETDSRASELLFAPAEGEIFTTTELPHLSIESEINTATKPVMVEFENSTELIHLSHEADTANSINELPTSKEDINGSELCAPLTCAHGGTCMPSQSNYTCVCLPGFEGRHCEEDVRQAVVVAECNSKVCVHGSCMMNKNNVTYCSCERGWTGSDCRMRQQDSCVSSPCLNQGTCINMVDDYRCLCVAGFSGERCELGEMCFGRRCRHGGTCTHHKLHPRCLCPEMYYGHWCEQLNPCFSNPCKNMGHCNTGIDNWTCDCKSGFTGNLCEDYINDCKDEPCQNSGICYSKGDGQYKCACRTGYTGVTCETHIDHCVSHPCQNGATCLTKVDGFSCQCGDGFTGSLCQQEVKTCESVSCKNGGRCENHESGPLCHCLPGYHGTYCEVMSEICACQPCHNGGKCVTTENSTAFTCRCEEGFMGLQCEYTESQLSACSHNPCFEGRCFTQTNGSDFICVCNNGFVGRACEKNVSHSPCTPSQCFNNGVCRVTETDGVAYQCICPDGFIGRRCENPMNYCEYHPCQHGGSCIRLTSGYLCECSIEYVGHNCENSLHRVDVCLSNPCLHGGICHSHDNNYFSCTCPTGYAGRRCEMTSDPCVSRPCFNAGTCRPGPGMDYLCICRLGYTGIRCQDIWPNHCSPNPCKDNGRCINTVSGYKCRCKDGVFGKKCQRVDRCHNNPCLHSGTCYNNGIDGFTCSCDKHFTGNLCESSVNSCLTLPCFNNGRCTKDADGDYSCKCPDAYSGSRCETEMPVCEISVCQNGGTCYMFESSFKCRCPEPFTGSLCHEPVQAVSEYVNESGSHSVLCEGGKCKLGIRDPCRLNPCRNGKCIYKESDNSVRDGYTCQCPSRYTGVHCETSVSCTDRPCGEHGTCRPDESGYVCECKDGYLGDNCERPKSCEDQPCIYGTCRPSDEGFVCICDDGHTGRYCVTPESSCSSNPCLSGATCVPGDQGYTCVCPATHTGQHCELDLTPCSSSPCQHGGNCTLHDNKDTMAYACYCQAGFFGRNCENANFCYNAPCMNGGLCKSKLEESRFVCVCKVGYTGDLCQTPLISQPDVSLHNGKNIRKKSIEANTTCGNATCEHNGRCIDREDSWICVCTLDYYGPECTQKVPMNRCYQDSCLHGGICQNDIDGFISCICPMAYDGAYCQTPIDLCSDIPCADNELCQIVETDFQIGYKCVKRIAPFRKVPQTKGVSTSSSHASKKQQKGVWKTHMRHISHHVRKDKHGSMGTAEVIALVVIVLIMLVAGTRLLQIYWRHHQSELLTGKYTPVLNGSDGLHGDNINANVNNNAECIELSSDSECDEIYTHPQLSRRHRCSPSPGP